MLAIYPLYSSPNGSNNSDFLQSQILASPQSISPVIVGSRHYNANFKILFHTKIKKSSLKFALFDLDSTTNVTETDWGTTNYRESDF
jgi:hypothetical protein